MIKKNGSFFGVSLGVGDPMNVTVLALRVLNGVSTIFIPVSEKNKESNALQRLKKLPVHLKDKEVTELYMPMKKEGIEKDWLIAKERVKEVLVKGNNCAFAGIGDLLHYGTFYYLKKLLNEEGFETIYVPGVTSYQALASLIDEPLVQGDEKLLLLPHDNLDVKEITEIDTIVFLKRPSNILLFKNLIKTHRLFLGEKLGMRGEKIGEVENLEKDLERLSYFSLIIAKRRR
ncbi:MAG: precorrin-2 C(20)-methyltransferase [Proteobacteria bacterium]|nr:precorrin-2 C(20)-methyltransferase [Pseudomonadota bacterium]